MQRSPAQTPQAVLQQLTLAFSRVPGVGLTSPVPNSLVATRKVIPAPAIVLAVLLFPIGLLFLLIKKTESVTILVTEREDSLSLKVSGSSDRKLISAIDSVLSAEGQTSIGPTRQDFAPQLIIFGGTFAVLGLILAVVQTVAVGILLSSGGLVLLAVGLRWRTAPASR
jgi:hypothetical protein